MNHYLLLLIVAAGLLWAVLRYRKFKRSGNIVKIKATGKPFIIPPEPVNTPDPQQEIAPPVPVNRAQRRRMEKAKKNYEKKFVGKTQRDEIRSGKIIEANDFLKQYFNGKK